MSNKTLGINLPLHITVLTPLHIGGNESFAPQADYILQQNELCFTDSNRLAADIGAAGLTEKYMQDVIDMAKEDKRNLLQQFIERDLRKPLETYTANQRRIPAFGIGNPTQLSGCIKTGDGLPYLPGSSMKGAIRSALLHRWLMSGSEKSDEALQSFLSALRHINSDKMYQREEKDLYRLYLETIEQPLFGALNQKTRLATSCLRVSDSAAIDWQCLGAYQLKRYALQGKESEIPLFKECLQPKTKLSLSVAIDYYHHEPTPAFHNLLNGIASKKNLFGLLNNYSYDVLKYETEILQGENVNERVLDGYISFAEEMLEDINNCGDRVAYLRLGYGKLQFYQTVAMAVFHLGNCDTENEDWQQYLRYCYGFSDKMNPDNYPSTRVLTVTGQLPLGWVKLS